MSFDELMQKVLDILPNAELGEDMDGQVVIYTNKQLDASGNLIEFEPEEIED